MRLLYYHLRSLHQESELTFQLYLVTLEIFCRHLHIDLMIQEKLGIGFSYAELNIPVPRAILLNDC